MGNRASMLLETLLPLGKVDPGLRAPEVPLDLATDRPRRAAAGGDRLRRAGRRGDQGRSLHPDGARGAGDDAAEDRHLGGDGVSAQPDHDGDERLDAGQAQQGPLHAGARQPGEGAYRAALRHDMVAGRAVDARVRDGGARGVEPLADRRAARRQGAALQHQSHGAAVQSGADRASRHPDPCRRGELGDVPHGRRGGRRHPRSIRCARRPTSSR